MSEPRAPYVIPITSGSALPNDRVLTAFSLVDITIEQAILVFKHGHGEHGRVWHWEKHKLLFIEPAPKVTYD